MARTKVLAIAPYPALATVIESVAPEFSDMDVTIYVGDLESGLAIAHSAFSENYDAVVSRGGTAQILEEELAIPVVEIEISTGDILRQTAHIPAEGPRLAAVGFGNAFAKLSGMADLMPRPIDVEMVDFADEVPLALERLAQTGHETFLCDNISYETAREMGLDAQLLVSGPESARFALDRVRFYLSQWREGVERGHLLWQIIQSLPGHFMLFGVTGELVYSDLPEELTWLLDEVERRFDDEWERLVLQRHHRIWRLRRTKLQANGREYVQVSVTSSREPARAATAGIEWADRTEVERALGESVFRAAGAEPLVADAVRVAIDSKRPVMLRGEVGSGKDQIVKMLYLESGKTQRPYVSVDCSLLGEKGQEFLTDSYASPLYASGQTICLRCLHALETERWHELLSTITRSGVCERNLVLLSGNDGEGGREPEVLTAFTERLRCHVMNVAPLRARPDGVEPAIRGYLAHAAHEAGRREPEIDEGALRAFASFDWPQNYLQIRRVIDWLLASCPGPHVTADDARAALERENAVRYSSTSTPSDETALDLMRPLASIERDVARLVLKSCGGNRTRAAEVLGISRTTMWRLLKD